MSHFTPKAPPSPVMTGLWVTTLFSAFAIRLLSVAILTFALETSMAHPDDELKTGSLTTNLALCKPCQVLSSREEKERSAFKLTDGERSSLGLSSKPFAAHADHSLHPEFIVVDLGTNCSLRRVVLYPSGDRTNVAKGCPEDEFLVKYESFSYAQWRRRA